MYYSVRSKNGHLIAGNEALPRYTQTLVNEQESYFSTTLRGEEVRVIAYATAVTSADSNDFTITEVAQTMHGHQAFQRELFLITIRQHLILISILFFGLLIAFRWTLRPLVQFGETLRERQAGSLEKLDEDKVLVELQPLISALNEYVARLDQTLSAYEQFVANTAHQLRTSFAIITSQIDFGHRHGQRNVEQAEVLKAIRKTVQQSTKVINQMLILAAVEQKRQQSVTHTTHFAAIIQTAIEELAPLAQQRHIELGIETLAEDAVLNVPQNLLRELIFNLLDNAITHMQIAGTVTVALIRQADQVILSVSDTGVGIAPEEREKVFERFYRIDESKPNSSGLGLAIIGEICLASAASITLTTPESGSGLLVRVVFPAAQ